MQQTEHSPKFVQIWNEQPLDSHHDIVVGINYALYNYNDTPTCGFCIAFFETIDGNPRGGGSGYSLGYTPNEVEKKIECGDSIDFGLEHALYGIGFDIEGKFAKETPWINGLFTTTPNSICLRDGIKNDYKVLFQSDNLSQTNQFEIAQQLKHHSEKIIYKQVRIIFSKCMSNLKVEAKKQEDDDYFTLFEKKFEIYNRKFLKVGLFYTSVEQNTKFELKEFNIAGYPWQVEKYDGKIKAECYQKTSERSNNFENKLPCGNHWFVQPNMKGFNLYKYNGKEFIKKQEIYSTNSLKILNYHKNLIFAKSANNLIIYKFLGDEITRQNVISLQNSDDITSCAAYNDTLVISTSSNSENYYVYNYVKESKNIQEIGTWRFYQKFNYPTINGFGRNIEMSENYLISYSTNDIIVSFKKDPNFGYVYHQTIIPPFNWAKGFGYSISLKDDNEMIVGSPFGGKRHLNDKNQGEVFHYKLSPDNTKWELFFEVGQYLNHNSLSGAFGYSVKIEENRLIIGSPFESSYIGLNKIENQGKVFLIYKDEYGFFTQNKTYEPNVSIGDSKKNYGTQVGIFENILLVGSPFSQTNKEGDINIYNIDCS